MSKFSFAYLLCAALVPSAAAQPLSPQTDSVEAAVINADYVFVARVIRDDLPEQDGEPDYGRNTVVLVEETLKQPFREDTPYTQVQQFLRYPDAVVARWKKQQTRLLLTSSDETHKVSVISLKPGDVEAMTADLTLLRDPAEVLRVARTAIRETPPGVRRVHTFGLQAPRETVQNTDWEPFYDAGGRLSVNVPVDDRLRDRAFRNLNSDDPQTRAEAARALRYFDSEEAAARLRALLDDAAGEIPAARREAVATLRRWGESLESRGEDAPVE
ncbi:HEAT repeat domain-containing protein [Alienimonas chondri]|uniref:HEAT repeat domain-containing protein n=1 Tax=Alienimonas chondri TaxID=2681879 RepID=A0ABX1V6S3_9PLAN|nr:HEAT repeat domain-containing protein [Alienimonas chondri]NNJ23984.1 hypothetical protein [Alienimonas chondri]